MRGLMIWLVLGSLALGQVGVEEQVRQVKAAVSVLEAKVGGATITQLRTLSQAIVAEAEAWKRAGLSEELVARLLGSREEIEDRILALDPDDATVRSRRGEMKLGPNLRAFLVSSLSPFVDADYLSEPEQGQARQVLEFLAEADKDNHGWIRERLLEGVMRSVTPLLAKRGVHQRMKGSSFGRKATALAERLEGQVARIWKDATANVEKSLSGIENEATRKAFRANLLKDLGPHDFQVVILEPFVILVEKDESWDAKDQAARNVEQPLSGLHRMLQTHFAKQIGLAPITEPLPVLYLKDHDSYQHYGLGRIGAPYPTDRFGHIEFDSGLLVLNADTDFHTKLYFGFLQLFRLQSFEALGFDQRAAWFTEGAAEWISGVDRQLRNGEFRYRPNRLLFNRLGTLNHLKRHGRLLPLRQLLKTVNTPRRRHDQAWKWAIASQGWALMHFLYNFRTDDEGLVQVETDDAPVEGIYRRQLLAYMKAEFEGRSGYAAFKEATGLDEPALEEMERQFAAYIDWMLHKRAKKQFDEKQARFLPWHQAREATRDDDRLSLPPK